MNIEWLLNCKPRPVQEEAILRSYYGYKARDSRDQTPVFDKIREGGPAVGWGHLLEMRLGKTPVMLNELMLLEKHQDIRRRIIISPNTYKHTWVKEFENFGLLTPVHAFETSKIGKVEDFLSKNPDDFVLIVNYEALVYDDPRKLLSGLMGAGSILVADESIKIKNHSSQFTRHSMALAKDAQYVRILTGLPMTQGPHDLYSQLRFIRGLDGKNFYAFRNRFCKMGGFKGKKIVGVREDQADALTDTINERCFVAKRKDWGRVTEPEHYIMELELTPKQQKHYTEMDEEFLTVLDEGQEITVDQVISKLLKLQQISSGWLYNEQGQIIEIGDPAKTPKILALIDIIENEIENKVIIPYHYSASGDLLMRVLERYNPAIIRSGQWMKKNGLNADDEKLRFNSDKNCRVILLQIQAGKYGHTLTGIEGDRCTHMLFFENTYSYDDRTQIEMRNTAETQDWTNVYIDFVSSPVERNAADALRKKEDLVSAVLGTYNPNKQVRQRNG